MIETLTLFFAFNAIGFWILAAALCIGIICAIENDHELIPFVLIGLMGWIYFEELWALAHSISWPLVAGCALAYVAAGIGWSVVKWARYVREVVKTSSNQSDAKYTLRLSHNKSKITGWLAYWPWSAFWTVGWGVTRDFWVYIYDSMEAVYQKIADQAISGMPEKPACKK